MIWKKSALKLFSQTLIIFIFAPVLTLFLKLADFTDLQNGTEIFLQIPADFKCGLFQIFEKLKMKELPLEAQLTEASIFLLQKNVVQTQVKLNSDIQMQLDVCSGYGVERREAERAFRLSSDWAVRAINEWKLHSENGYKGILFPIVQGNFLMTLERKVLNL